MLLSIVTPAHQKEIALVLSSIALSIILWWGFAWALSDSFESLGLTITVAVLAVLWCMSTAITLLVGRHWLTPVAIAAAASAAAITAGGLSWGALGGGAVTGLCTAAAWYAFKRDSSNLRRFRATTIFAGGTRLLVTGVIVAAAGVALPFLEGKIAQTGLQVSPQQVAWVLRPLQPLLEDLMPSLNPDTDITTIIDNQLRRQGVDPATLPPPERQRIHEQFSQQFATTVTGQESLSEVLAGRFNETLARVTQTNALTVALVALVVAFLTIRALIPIVSRLLIMGIAAGIWAACRAGLLVAQKQTVEAETLTLERIP